MIIMIVFIDDTGAPIIDEQGRCMYVSGNVELKQRLTNVFMTQLDSEVLFPGYGFDYIGFVQNPSTTKDTLFRYACTQALNPTNIYGISQTNSVTTSISGSTGYVTMSLTDDDGNTITQEVTLNVA